MTDFFVLTDAGSADKLAYAVISAAGVITFRLCGYVSFTGLGNVGVFGNTTSFTNSSTKGLPAGWSMQYERIRLA